MSRRESHSLSRFQLFSFMMSHEQILCGLNEASSSYSIWLMENSTRFWWKISSRFEEIELIYIRIRFNWTFFSSLLKSRSFKTKCRVQKDEILYRKFKKRITQVYDTSSYELWNNFLRTRNCLHFTYRKENSHREGETKFKVSNFKIQK